MQKKSGSPKTIHNIKQIEHQSMHMKKQIDSKLALKTIDLRNSNAWDHDLQYIPRDGVSTIEQVLLWNNNITYKGVETISLCKWENLVKLDIDKNRLRSKGLKYLSRLHAPTLKEINLCSNQIEKEGILHIMKADWPQLQIFYLNGNKIGGQSIKHLNKSNWKHMRDLHLYNTRLTFYEIKELVLCDWILHCTDIALNLISNNQQTKLKILLKQKFMHKT